MLWHILRSFVYVCNICIAIGLVQFQNIGIEMATTAVINSTPLRALWSFEISIALWNMKETFVTHCSCCSEVQLEAFSRNAIIKLKLLIFLTLNICTMCTCIIFFIMIKQKFPPVIYLIPSLFQPLPVLNISFLKRSLHDAAS